MATSDAAIEPTPALPRDVLGWLRLWFLLRDPVGRKAYAISGFGLMAFKYVVEMLVLGQLTGLLYTPLGFVNPSFSARSMFLQGAPEWLGMAWVIWTLPFLWISVSMSVRRALDAGLSPWHGLWMFVPWLNLVCMLVLACWPSAEWSADLWDPELGRLRSKEPKDIAAPLKAGLGGIAVGALYASVMIQLSIYVLESYGVVLFFGTPFVTGVASGYLFNLRGSQSHAATLGVAFLSVMLTGMGLMVFGIEGAVCLLMATPILVPLGVMGAPLGKFLADRRRRMHGGLVGALLVVPLLAVAETQMMPRTEFVVVSSVEIAAPAEKVWRQVIAFPEIEERPEWFFRMGISCPLGARIKGQGVGATRECLFTTGKFVEPITMWDAPRQLAFDVREQPEPMFEMTPYRDIHPPHLDGSFRSTRGEFELAELPNGYTRLTGRTWYTLDIHPHAYWTIWTDWLLHRIHLRVLRHIQRLAEGDDLAAAN